MKGENVMDKFIILMMSLLVIMGVQLSVMTGSHYPVLIVLHMDYMLYMISEAISELQQ